MADTSGAVMLPFGERRASRGKSGETACVPTLVNARKRGVLATPTTAPPLRTETQPTRCKAAFDKAWHNELAARRRWRRDPGTRVQPIFGGDVYRKEAWMWWTTAWGVALGYLP